MASTTSFAALSIWSVVTWSESRSCWIFGRASYWANRMMSMRNWQRSMRGLGIGRIKRGWSRVVGYVSTEGGYTQGSPIRDISARRALWSLYSVHSVVVVVDGGYGTSFGICISQWSSGELVGM